MRFNVADGFRVNVIALVDLLLQRALRLHTGRSDAVGAPVLIKAMTDNDAVNDIMIGQRSVQRLEDYHAHAFARHKTVRSAGESFATSIRGQHPRLTGDNMHLWSGHQRHAARQRQFAIAVLQGATGQMDRHQGRGTGGIERNRRPFQIQPIGQPGRQNRIDTAHAELRDRQTLLAERMREIVALTGPDIDRTAAISEIAVAVTGIFQRLPRLFQKQPLLRVHHFRFLRGNVEKQRIEAVHSIQETAMPTIGAIRTTTVRVIARLHIPTFRGNFADRIHARREIVPECIKIRRTGEASRHTDNGYRRVASSEWRVASSDRRVVISEW